MAEKLVQEYRKLHTKRLMADLGGAKNIQRMHANGSILTVKVRVANLVMPSGQFLYDGFVGMTQTGKLVQVTVNGSANKMRWQLRLFKLSGHDGFENYDSIPNHPQAEVAALIFESFGPQYNLKRISCPDDGHLEVQIVDLSLVSPDKLFYNLQAGITRIQRSAEQVVLTLPHAEAIRMLIYFYQ